MNRLANEFIGTFFLVFTICVAAVYEQAGPTAAPLAIGFVLVALVYAGGHISRAHYNPSVSLAFWIRGCYISIREMLAFIAVQIVGAAAAATVARLFFRDGMEVAPVDLSPAPALVGEILFTFMLVWVIMNVATARANAGNQFYGIAIGFTVAGAIYTVGPFSLAMLNPAVALALVMVEKLPAAEATLPVTGSLVGAAIATLAFNLGHPSEKCSTDPDAACPPID